MQLQFKYIQVDSKSLSFLCSFLNNLIFHLNRLKGGVCILIIALIVALIRLYNH